MFVQAKKMAFPFFYIFAMSWEYYANISDTSINPFSRAKALNPSLIILSTS
jgi:hypothetical protein